MLGRSLVWNSGRNSMFVFTCVLLPLVGCDRKAPTTDGVLGSLVAANPCNESLPEIGRTPDSLTPSQWCALLVAAMGRFAHAGSSDLPQPADFITCDCRDH